MSENIYINPSWFKNNDNSFKKQSKLSWGEKRRLEKEKIRAQRANSFNEEISSLHPNDRELLNLILGNNNKASNLNLRTVNMCGSMFSRSFYRFSPNISIEAKVYVIFFMPIYISGYYLIFGDSNRFNVLSEINYDTIEAFVPGRLNRYIQTLIPAVLAFVMIIAIIAFISFILNLFH